MGQAFLVHLIHQFLGILFGGCRDLDLYLLFRVGIGLDVHTVYKDRPGGKVSRLRHFLQDPTEYLHPLSLPPQGIVKLNVTGIELKVP